MESVKKSQSIENNPEPLVSIIILNYNAGKLLIECVESIFKSKYKNVEIILVDNVSIDNSHKKCKEKFPKIKLIENTENLGYCEGNNVGLRSANGEYIVILNPDTIVDENWLNELFNAYQKNGDGIYQPKFLAIDNHDMLLSTGNMIQIFGFGYSRGKGESNSKQYEKFEKINYASGTCIFTAKKIFEKVGEFNPFLFAFHDDLELCWRALLEKIFSYYVPKSIVYHPIEGTSFKWSPLKFKLMERNRKYCLLTLYNRKTIAKMLPALLIVDIAVFLFYTSKGLTKMKISADWEIFKNLKSINIQYKKNQENRKIYDHEVISQFKDEVEVPAWVINNTKNRFFNKFLVRISKISRVFL